MIGIANSIVAGAAGIGYLLKDDFSTDVAAGSVHATDADPGPGGARAVVDTDSLLSVDGGLLSVDGGLFVPANGDPGIWWPLMTRVAGRMLIADLTTGLATVRTLLGWDNGQAGPPDRHGFYFYSDGTLRVFDVGANLKVGIDYTADTNYKLAIVLRSTGAFYFVRISGQWELVFVSDLDANASQYPSISNYDMVISSSFVRVPSKLWLPAAVASDSFEASRPALEDEADLVDAALSGPVALGAAGIGDDLTSAFFNADDACIKLGGATFDEKFSGDYGTALCFAKIRAAADWADVAAYRYTVHMRDHLADTNYVVMGKSNVANELVWRHRSAGLVHDLTHDFGPAPTTDFFSQAMTWDVDVPELIAYVDGSAVETPLDTIEAMEPRNWSSTGTNVIGAGSLTAQEWPGSIAHMILGYGVAASAADIDDMHTKLAAGTLATSDLDTIFGEGNWSWWKLDEQDATDGEGHPEGVSGSLGSGGDGKLWTQQAGFWTVQNDQAEVAEVISSLAIATVDAGSKDVVVSAKLTRVAGEVGIAARYQDGDNYLRAFHDGINVKLMQRVGAAQSTLFSAARAYAQGSTLRLVVSGQRAALYYNDEAVNAQPTPVSAGLTATNHGLYSTDAGNTIDDFCILRAGAAGEHSELERYL